MADLWFGVHALDKDADRVSVKFRVPVSRMMYGMVAFFFVMTVVWTVIVDVVWLEQTIRDVGMFLVFGVAMPIVWFIIFLFTVKCTFLNFHELRNRELIVSVPPRHVRVPLEEIEEIESDAGKVSTEFGWQSVDVKYEDREEGSVASGRFKGKFLTFGVHVTPHFGDKTLIESVFSDKNLILIKAKRHEITTNVADVKEFVEEVLKAIRKLKNMNQ